MRLFDKDGKEISFQPCGPATGFAVDYAGNVTTWGPGEPLPESDYARVCCQRDRLREACSSAVRFFETTRRDIEFSINDALDVCELVKGLNAALAEE